MTTDLLEKIPPQDGEAEQATIGAMLLEREAIISAETTLHPNDFYREAHRTICGGIFDLYHRNEPVDLITLGGWLRDHEQLDLVGGTLYLTTLMAQTPTTAGIERYAGKVRQCSLRRALIAQADTIMDNAYRMDLEFDEVLSSAEDGIYRLGEVRNLAGGPVRVGELAATANNRIEAEAVADKPAGFRTDWKSINGITRPFQPGHLNVIAAASGMGKTAWALNLAIDLAEAGAHGLIFSLEMEGSDLAMRAILEKMVYTQDDIDEIRGHEDKARILAAAADATERLWNLPLHIDDSGSNGLSDMERVIRKHTKRRGKLTFIVVDYMQLVPPDAGSGRKRYEEVGGVAKGLKQLAKRYKLAVFALSQITEKGIVNRKNHRPFLSDLYESSAIEHAADMVAAIYRPGYYGKEEMTAVGLIPEMHDEVTEFNILKYRHGPTRSTKQYYNGAHYSFRDLTSEEWKSIHGKGI